MLLQSTGYISVIIVHHSIGYVLIHADHMYMFHLLNAVTDYITADSVIVHHYVSYVLRQFAYVAVSEEKWKLVLQHES